MGEDTASANGRKSVIGGLQIPVEDTSYLPCMTETGLVEQCHDIDVVKCPACIEQYKEFFSGFLPSDQEIDVGDFEVQSRMLDICCALRVLSGQKPKSRDFSLKSCVIHPILSQVAQLTFDSGIELDYWNSMKDDVMVEGDSRLVRVVYFDIFLRAIRAGREKRRITYGLEDGGDRYKVIVWGSGPESEHRDYRKISYENLSRHLGWDPETSIVGGGVQRAFRVPKAGRFHYSLLETST